MGQRVQRHRGKALPLGARSVARGSRWGNPYVWRAGDLKPGRVLVTDRDAAVARYVDDLAARDDLDAWLAPLVGWDLACYCALGDLCHADALLQAIDALDDHNPGT